MQMHQSGAVWRADSHELAHQKRLERRLNRYRPEVRPAVYALARRHARLADLAESFPALLFALAVPRNGFSPKPVIDRVVEGCNLAQLAAAAELPIWLRKIAPDKLLRPIPLLPDNMEFHRRIVNHLPRSAKHAPAWLYVVGMTAQWGDDELAIWCARHMSERRQPQMINRLHLIILWAWFSQRPDTDGYRMIKKIWNPSMQVRAAVAAARDWRDTIDLYVNLGERNIADIWLAPGVVDGYEFVPLQSNVDVAEEAAAMQNCVRIYGYDLAHNRARLWSMRKDGQRVATIEVGLWRDDPFPSICQLKAAQNKQASKEAWWAARRWLHAQDLPKVTTNPIGWDTAPLQRKAWTALWKPYWLAKGHIPDWLPLMPSRDVWGAL